MVTIRTAEQKDLKQIAQVHFHCFPDSFSTQLGKFGKGYLQQKFYAEYLSDIPELFLVAEDDSFNCYGTSQIIGFCMGYFLHNNDYIRQFFLHNLIPIGVQMGKLLITGNRPAWKRVVSLFDRKQSFQIINNQFKINPQICGDILSICVLPEYRGFGVAQSLIDAFMTTLIQHDKTACLLTVAANNERAIRFYERNGFVPYKEIGMTSRTYVKKLPDWITL